MTILHLEDSDNDALVVETLLHEEWPDCRIRRASSRAEFESALQFDDFDLVLSDYQMPGFDGISALETVRTHRPETPFVFISGTIGEERAIDAMKHGAADYVIKDRPARLVPAVRQALGRMEETNRRRRAEEALRQNQERFRQIAENVADMIAVLDLEGRRVYLNPAYRSVLGDPDTLRGTNSFEEIHPEDRERVRAAFFETVRSGAGQRLEYRFLLRDGTVRYIESQGSVIRHADGHVSNVLVVSRDVTARRAAELQLREQASLLDKARDAIIAMNLEHRISYWNASAERIYGWTAAEVLGRDVRELALELDPQSYATAHAQALAKGEWHGQFRLRARGGGRVDIASTWSLVLDSARQPRSILRIDTDITEAKQLETQLLRSQRAESMGTLTGGIAHDLNNVLAPILMGAGLLRTVPLDETATRIVDTIETSAEHGAALVRQLLGYARGTEGERVQVPPKRLLEDVAGLLRQTLPRRIEVQLEAAGPLPAVLADATQLKQLLLNLCLNARDAMPAGGVITIGAEAVTIDEQRASTLPESSPGEYLHLRVSDTGSGIPPEILERIFDPFFTTKEAGKGTGLGLSMVRGIVKGHQGCLQVDSTVGVGTTFHIYIPAVEAARPTPAAPPRGTGEAIFVIDDDPAVREMLPRFLQQHGYRVVAAVDSREGLEGLRQKHRDVAAVITGVSRAGTSAAQTLASLAAAAPGVPVVVCSSHPGDAGASDPTERIHAVIAKPLEPAQLLAALRKVLASATVALAALGAQGLPAISGCPTF